MSTLNATLGAAHPTPLTATYNYSIGYLRAFIVALVVADHAAVAYYSIAPPLPKSFVEQPRLWWAYPIIDPHKWSGFSLFLAFNDTVLISLMFFLSGLFVCHSLTNKGAVSFLRGRLLRLGLPFVVAAGVLAPLAYFPAYLEISGHNGVADFCHQWLSLGNWPAGPVWFIWVLLAFDCIAALLFVLAPGWGLKLARLTSGAARRPVIFLAALIAVSAAAYIPLAHRFTFRAWSSFGPFSFQTSRIVHYLVYFLVGAGTGAWGLNHGLLSPRGKLARGWALWLAAALVFFLGAIAIILIATASGSQSKASKALTVAMEAGFVVSCAAFCFAFLALFLRFAQSRSRVCDSLAANSYGIYLIHYAAVTWLQYALLPTAFPAIAKWLIVFPCALMLSWALTGSIRRIPSVARVI
jgi:peptidoglycan/LPS O-acetylase OafA/YrhL